MKADTDVGKWFRDRTSNVFMEFLDVLVSEHAAELSRHHKARQALLNLSPCSFSPANGGTGFAGACSDFFDGVIQSATAAP